MAKVFHIVANPLKETSSSLKLANAFISEYMKKNPGDAVDTIDLHQAGIRYYDTDDHVAVYVKKGQNLTGAEQSKYAQRNALVDQFLSADKYVVTAPMWNFGVPAVLKAYIDMIAMPGRTFAYTKSGVEGLVKGKKIIFFGARGGAGYGTSPMAKMEMQIRYLENLFGFIGITDQAHVAVEGTASTGREERLKEAISKAEELARKF